MTRNDHRLGWPPALALVDAPSEARTETRTQREPMAPECRRVSDALGREQDKRETAALKPPVSVAQQKPEAARPGPGVPPPPVMTSAAPPPAGLPRPEWAPDDATHMRNGADWARKLVFVYKQVGSGLHAWGEEDRSWGPSGYSLKDVIRPEYALAPPKAKEEWSYFRTLSGYTYWRQNGRAVQCKGSGDAWCDDYSAANLIPRWVAKGELLPIPASEVPA